MILIFVGQVFSAMTFTMFLHKPIHNKFPIYMIPIRILILIQEKLSKFDPRSVPPGLGILWAARPVTDCDPVPPAMDTSPDLDTIWKLIKH